MRKLLTGLAAATLFVLLAFPVAAQGEGLPCDPTAHGNGPASWCTVHMHNLTDTFTDVVPCTDASVEVTISDANLIFHITRLENGTYWATFTEEGRFTAVAPGVTYSGHFAAWDGEAWNLRNATFTGTFNLVGTGSDGSRVTAHGLFHLNFDAAGMPHMHMHFLC